jgi:hypothetical protein
MTTQATTPEQKRLAAGLRAWLWGAGIQLAFASIFAFAHLIFIVRINVQAHYKNGWLTPESEASMIRLLTFLGLAHNLALIGAWGFKAYASARMIRPIGDHAFNMSTLIGRLLMVVGSAPLLYCAMVRAMQVLNATPGTPQTVNWAWTLPSPLNAIFLIGAACLAVLLASRAGYLRLGILLAFLLLLGILPDALNLLALRARIALEPGQTLALPYRLIAALSPLLLAIAITCEFYAVRRLRTLG